MRFDSKAFKVLNLCLTPGQAGCYDKNMTTTALKKNIKKAVDKFPPASTRLLFDFVKYLKDKKAEIEDSFKELASPKLLKSIADGRKAYKAGRVIPYAKSRKGLGLK